MKLQTRKARKGTKVESKFAKKPVKKEMEAGVHEEVCCSTPILSTVSLLNPRFKATPIYVATVFDREADLMILGVRQRI